MLSKLHCGFGQGQPPSLVPCFSVVMNSIVVLLTAAAEVFFYNTKFLPVVDDVILLGIWVLPTWML